MYGERAPINIDVEFLTGEEDCKEFSFYVGVVGFRFSE